MKKIYIIYIVVLLVFIFLFAVFLFNEGFIHKYNNGSYDKSSILRVVNLRPFSYISQYNYGNYYYKVGSYDDAIERYKKALKLFPPEKKECSIRINLALAMLKKIDFDSIDTEDEIKETIEKLEEAKEVLLEDGCANRYDNGGHSKEAEQLKKEIEDMIEKLKNAKSTSENDKPSDDKNDKDEPEEKDTQNGKERQLRQINTDSMQERRNKMEFYTREYEYYKGKKW